jgi:hypothetical protein
MKKKFSDRKNFNIRKKYLVAGKMFSESNYLVAEKINMF